MGLAMLSLLSAYAGNQVYVVAPLAFNCVKGLLQLRSLLFVALMIGAAITITFTVKLLSFLQILSDTFKL